IARGYSLSNLAGPAGRNIVDWFIFLAVMGLAAISVNPKITLPNGERGVQTPGTIKTYEETWIFTGCFTVILLAIYCLIAILLDKLLYDGRLSQPWPEKRSPQPSKKIENQQHDTSQQTAVSIYSTPKNASNSTDIESPTDDVTFLWKQMVLIRQQHQELQLLDGSSIQDINAAYFKLVHVESLLQPLLPVLDGMLARQKPGSLSSKIIQTYRLAIDDAIKKIRSQTFDITDQYNNIKFSHMMSSQVNLNEAAEGIVYSAEKYMHIRLDRQQVAEELIETEEDVNILDERLHFKMDEDNSNDFSGQLETQVAILVHRIKQ
ncbi:14798_t:CDS:2, partial [Acaulospora colombiana]